MTVSKKVKLDGIDMPIDIIEDTHRLKAIEEGQVKSISKGPCEQGVLYFKISKVHIKPFFD